VYICYYFLNFLRDDEVGNDTFLASLIVSMPLAKEGKILIKILFSIKDYNAKDLVREFPSKGWNVDLVYKLLQKLRIARSVGHSRSGRRRSTRIADNIDLAYELVSQKVAKREIIFAHCT